MGAILDYRYEPARFPALKELALAEARTEKRRVRLECAGSAAAVAPGAG